MDQIEIELYALPGGKEPFTEWESDLSGDVEAIVSARLARVRGGNFGDSMSVGQGVYELRIHYGPGYRIYYGKKGKKIVILLCGGNKSTQKKDMNLSFDSSQSLYGTLLGAFRASALVNITVPIFTSGSRQQKIASKPTINELLRIKG